MEIAMNRNISRILNKEEQPSSIKMMKRRITMAIVVMKYLQKYSIHRYIPRLLASQSQRRPKIHFERSW